ncbi:MAG TPA: hypothetical protein VJ914_36210 [Pseudonocardiaceae bacterium]|nr:hypothetical protein [Pseudonocardiaceae bacterium]
MRMRKGARTAMLALLGVLGIGLAVSAAGSAAPARPDFALTASPASQTVRQGQSTSYTVTATTSGSFTGNVSLAATGKPPNTTTTFSPATLTPAKRTALLTVATAPQTPLGTYNLTITGTSGALSHSISLRLTVNPPLALSVSPATVTVPAGSTATYTIAITRTNVTGPVGIAVSSGLPPGVTSSLQPNPTTGNSSTLTLTVATSTKDGSYPVGLVARAATGEFAYTQTQLVVSTPKSRNFTISGNATGALAPGVPPQPLNLTLANPNNQKLAISNLTVTVSRTSAGTACGPANFVVTQYRGSYPLNLAGRQTASLAQLGIASSAFPTVGMLDLPTNQDACQGATVNLVYSGSGQGA